MEKFVKSIAIVSMGLATIVAMTTDIFMGAITMIIFGIFACILSLEG